MIGGGGSGVGVKGDALIRIQSIKAGQVPCR